VIFKGGIVFDLQLSEPKVKEPTALGGVNLKT